MRFASRVLVPAFLVLSLFPVDTPAAAGISAAFAPEVTIGDRTVPLRGAGTFVWMGLIDVYDAALYLPEGVPNRDVLGDVPKRLELYYHVSIKGEKFGGSAEPYLRKNVPPERLSPLMARIELINRLYRDVREGDRYDLTYLPGKGTTLSLNGAPLGTIEGADFAAAYFAIWLGDHPISEKMRDRLLGGEGRE